MIISASYRTDIPAFYGDWFRRRLDAGFCLTYNAFARTASRVSLRPADVDGFVFWTKNVAPFWSALDTVRGLGLPFVVQFTITGYPRALEAAVTPPERAMAALHRLATTYGPETTVWRFDPVLVTSLTDADWHRATFRRLCAAAVGATTEVVVSTVQWYRKTTRNIAAAARAEGFAVDMLDDAVQRALLADLAIIASDHGLAFSVCAQPTLIPAQGQAARCVDAGRLSRVAGRPVLATTHGNRPGCLCAQNVDIGAYDTCPHGCVYCYAVADRERARAAWRTHDPAGPFLIPPPEPYTMHAPATVRPHAVQMEWT